MPKKIIFHTLPGYYRLSFNTIFQNITLAAINKPKKKEYSLSD